MSKLLLFDFRCTNCGEKFEEYVRPDVKAKPCPKCASEGKRIISGTRLDIRMGIDPDFSTMGDKWERSYMSGVREAQKRQQEHGDEE
jgi:putative FmdB family regulatory protein